MSQQARPVLTLPAQASGAIAFARAVNVVAPPNAGQMSVAQASTAGQKVVGFAARAAATGEWVDITAIGTAVAEAGAAITVGSRVSCDSQGRVVAASALAIAAGATAVTSAAANGATDITGGDAPQYVIGTALQAAGAAGDLIEVLIAP